MVVYNHSGYLWGTRVDLEAMCVRMNPGAETPACGPLAAVQRIKSSYGPKMVDWGWTFMNG